MPPASQTPPPWRIVFAAALALSLAGPALALTPPPPTAAPRGPEVVVADALGAARFAPAVAVFDDGGFAAAWLDATRGEVLLRIFDAGDQPRGEPVTVGAGPGLGQDSGFDRGAPALTLLENGVLLVAWVAGSCPGGPSAHCATSIMGRLHTADGSPLGPAFRVDDRPGAHFDPRVAGLPGLGGRFVVIWTIELVVEDANDPQANYSDVLGRLFTGGGGALGASFLVNEDPVEEQNAGGVAGTHDGGFVAVWESWEGEAGFFDVFRRRFGPLGAPLEGEVQVNDPAFADVLQFEPDVAAFPDGGHVVVWTDRSRDAGGNDGAIVYRTFAADGTPADFEELLANLENAGDQHSPAVAIGAFRDLVITWTDACASEACAADADGMDGSGSGVFASYLTEFLGFGVAEYDRPLALTTELDQGATAVASRRGRWVSAWASEVAEGSTDAAIHARRIDFPGPVNLPGECPVSSLCLDLGLGHAQPRFQVGVVWEDFAGGQGNGVPVVRGDGWGTFWFFGPDNIELAVKILDGRGINGRFWVFAAGLSNVRYTLVVLDVVTGGSIVWVNPAGTFLSRADTETLSDLGASAAMDAHRFAPAAATVALPLLAPAPAPLTIAPCAPGELCVGGDRFRIEATWTDFAGKSGAAFGDRLTADTAWLWFFGAANPELLVKVLDGRGVNGHFWVFFASLSNVAFDLTVTDRVTGHSASYENPLGAFASRGDTTALPP